MIRRLLCVAIFLSRMQAQDASFPLESVSLEGSAFSKELVLEIAGLRIGSPVNKAAIEAGCLKLKESGFFESINYRYAAGPKRGYVLTLTLADQGPLQDATIDIPGIDENELWQWLVSRYPAFNGKVPESGAAQQFIAGKFEDHLGPRLDGQRLVVRMETDLARGGKMTASFQPETLPRIASMSFSGQSELSAAELLGVMQKVMAGRGYTDRAFRQAVELNLRPAYEQHGMYRVRFPRITMQKASPSSVAVTTAVEEGAKFTLGDVQLVGDNLPVDAMLKAASFKKGQVANWAEIQKGIWELEKPPRRLGYFETRARPERVLHDDQRVLDVRITFYLGPLYRFGQLRITGLTPSLEAQARKVWRLQPGDPFDYAYPMDFLQAFFQSVDARQFKKADPAMHRASAGPVMDITLVFELR
jgi:outer membrane protein assembly factor BamA